VSDERPSLDPLGLAMDWVTKITMVALEMVLPALGGYWLDKRNGTSYWAIMGVVVGLVAGMWHLLLMTRAFDSGNRPKRTGDKSSNE
jgi:F0F1-type ATP synthase assembly protein I